MTSRRRAMSCRERTAACRGTDMRYYKFHDFWDTLVKDIGAIEQKAKEEEEEKKSRWKGTLRLFWTEEFESSSQKRRVKRERLAMNAERKLAAKAALETRREKLRQLLENESKMLKEEMDALEEILSY